MAVKLDKLSLLAANVPADDVLVRRRRVENFIDRVPQEGANLPTVTAQNAHVLAMVFGAYAKQNHLALVVAIKHEARLVVKLAKLVIKK